MFVFAEYGGRVRRLRIQLQEPPPRKLHALHKNQGRIFMEAAPVSFGAKRALSAFQCFLIKF